MDHKLVKPPPTAAIESANSHRTRRRRAHSFSSSLLESICQSMDEDDHHSSRRSQSIDDVKSGKVVSSHSHLNLHRQLNIKVSKQNRAEMVVLQAGKVTKAIQNHRVQVPSLSSSSSSNFSYSDSSSNHGRVSSSVSSYGPDSADSSSSSCFSTCSSKSPTSSIKEKITKAKLRAIKLYTELKNPKKTKPESPPLPPPRCRFARYLSSIFTPKKQSKTEHRISTNPPTTSITKPKPPPISTDRKAPLTAITKTMTHDQQDVVKGREIFKKCQEKIVRGLKMREFVEELGRGGGDDDNDDAESYASSDLFELEFLMERGGDELPVFETTDIKINQAIANGFSL